MPHWQLNGRAGRGGGLCACKGGGGGRGCERRSAATDFQSMDSLSLSTSGEDFAPLWQTWKDSLWTLEATGAKNTKSTCSTTVSCFAIMVQIVWIFFFFLPFQQRICFFLSCIINCKNIYTTMDTTMYDSFDDP